MSTQKIYGDADFLGVVTGAGGGGEVQTFSTTSMIFPVDPASSLVVPPGTIFTNQTEIDDFLTANAATHFKYVMDCFDALPHDVFHTVYFELSPGIHRPRNPEPAGDVAAWCFADYAGQPRHHRFHRGPFSAGGFLSLTSIAYDAVYWTDVHGDEAVVSVHNSPTYERYIEVAPGTFTPGELRGKYARIDSSPTFPLLIRENTDSLIYVGNNISGVPTTVKIQKQGIIFRNSYDDVNPAVNKPLIVARADGFLEFSRTLVLDSILFEQYAQTQPVIRTAGRIYHDMFMSGCDQADLLDNGIDSRGQFIYAERGGFHAQFWRCFWRGQKDSIIAPTNNSQAPFVFSADQNPLLNGRFPMQDSALRGGSNPSVAKGMIFLLSNTYFGNWSVPPFQFSYCKLSAGNPVMFVDCTSRCLDFVRGNEFDSSLHTYFDNIGPSATSAHLFYISGDDNYLNWGSANVFVGPNPNAGRTLYMASSYGNRVLLNAVFVDGALSAAGDMWLPIGADIPFSELDTLRVPARQPSGAMAGIVHILQVSGGTTVGVTKNLVFNTAGNLLSYDGGAGVDISGLGTFVLVGSGGDWIVVAVAAVPGANQTFPVNSVRGWMEDFRGNRINKVS